MAKHSDVPDVIRAQTTNRSNTSRRVILRTLIGTAAAVPLALPVLAPAAALSDAGLLAMEAEIERAWAHLGSVCDELAVAERTMAEWEQRNPRPKIAEFEVGTEAEYKIWWADVQAHGGDETKATAFDPNGALKRAMRDHAAAIREWKPRHERAKDQSGLNRAHDLETAANNRVSAATDAMVLKAATTLEGYRCKARCARKTGDSDLAWSIVDDLMGAPAAIAEGV
jgi:hypothetical protein